MIKASRAYTGRPKIAKAEGAYHGHTILQKSARLQIQKTGVTLINPIVFPVHNGTPQGVLDDVIIFPYNDIERTLQS